MFGSPARSVGPYVVACMETCGPCFRALVDPAALTQLAAAAATYVPLLSNESLVVFAALIASGHATKLIVRDDAGVGVRVTAAEPAAGTQR